MDRNANAAPAVDDIPGESFGAAQTRVRSVLGLQPERCLRAEEQPTLEDVDARASVREQDTAVPRTSAVRAKLLSPGTCVAGKYIICDVLGTGGSAVVYAAEQVGLKRVVAFKLYPVADARASRLLARFEREAQLLARVHHENVVAVFDAGSMPDGSPYLVVQRLHGESLATRLSSGPLQVAEAVDLTRQLLNALSALDDAGITHRDVKPGNLVLDRQIDGSALLKLVDFGIAKETWGEWSRANDEMVGTPRYMAPEQVRGEQIDARCDLYAAAVTLYEMLSGRTPHTGETVEEITTATLVAPIVPLRALRPDCPEGLERIVMRGLARNPADRFASAREMRRALDRWQADPQPLARVAADLQTGSPVEQVNGRAQNEDTLRLPTRVLDRVPARRRLGKQTALAVTCLLAALLVSHELELRPARRVEPSVAPAQTAVMAPQRLESSLLVPMLKTMDLIGAQVVKTSASATELVSRASTSVRERIAHLRRAALQWRDEARNSASAK